MEEHVTSIARATDGRRQVRSPWQSRPVEIVLPIDVVRKMFQRARRWSTEEGGRFESRTNAVLLEGAGHNAHVEAPERVWQFVKQATGN